MPNYELTENGLTTMDPCTKIMFWDDASLIITGQARPSYLSSYHFCDDTEITIPYAELKSAIAPVEGEAFVEIGFGDVATDGLILYGANDTMSKPDVEKRLNWRVIILCQDYGELRELLAAVERCG